MHAFEDSQMRKLDRNKQPKYTPSVQHILLELDQRLHPSCSASQAGPTAQCDSYSPTSTVTFQHLPMTPPNKFEYTNGIFKQSLEGNESFYKQKQHRNESVVYTKKHGYTCSTQKPNEVMSDDLSVNVDRDKGSVIRWAPGSQLRYFVSRTNLAKDDGKLENMRAAIRIATENWQSTGMNITFLETPVREEATFVVIYRPLDTDYYAKAFFPGAEYRYICISSVMFEPQHVEHMSCVLGHEIGHVLGLRHEFWKRLHERDNARYFPTEDHDSASIMNNENVYDLSLFVLSDPDRKNIRRFYALQAGSQYDFTITNYDPVPLPLA
jgi:hypothetical protein